MVGIQSNLSWQVECYGKTRSAVCEQIFVAFVGFLSVSHAGVLAHCPKTATVHGGLNSAGEGILPGISNFFIGFAAIKIRRRVNPTNGNVRGGFRINCVVFKRLFRHSCLF